MYVEDVLLPNQRKLDAYVYRSTPYLLVDSEITVAWLIMYRRVNHIYVRDLAWLGDNPHLTFDFWLRVIATVDLLSENN